MESLLYLAFFFLGAVIASFATVVAERLYTGEPWISGRSRCNSCGRYLTGLDLVPILSWVLSRGRCRTCGARIPASYAVLEAVAGVVFALAYHALGLSLLLIPFLLSLCVLAFIVVYDLRHTVVPPVSSTLLIILCGIYALMASPDLGSLGTTLLTAGCIGLGFFLMHALSKGRAMGLADAPVAFALSLLASPYALTGLLFSFWSGAVVGIAILLMRREGPKMGIEVPFVPFLAIGYVLAFFIAWNPFALV